MQARSKLFGKQGQKVLVQDGYARDDPTFPKVVVYLCQDPKRNGTSVCTTLDGKDLPHSISDIWLESLDERLAKFKAMVRAEVDILRKLAPRADFDIDVAEIQQKVDLLRTGDTD